MFLPYKNCFYFHFIQMKLSLTTNVNPTLFQIVLHDLYQNIYI